MNKLLIGLMMAFVSFGSLAGTVSLVLTDVVVETKLGDMAMSRPGCFTSLRENGDDKYKTINTVYTNAGDCSLYLKAIEKTNFVVNGIEATSVIYNDKKIR